MPIIVWKAHLAKKTISCFSLLHMQTWDGLGVLHHTQSLLFYVSTLSPIDQPKNTAQDHRLVTVSQASFEAESIMRQIKLPIKRTGLA